MEDNEEIARCADAFEDELTVLQVSHIFLQSRCADVVVRLRLVDSNPTIRSRDWITIHRS
jgi:hypothetical protein